MFFRKGAMFGLDARIALSIFGALSVISGASLYSAITESKAVSMLYDLREIGKALESYYLDVGETPKLVNARDIKMLQLVENNSAVSNWRGPYLGYSKHPSDQRVIYHSSGGRILILYIKDNWGSYDYTGPWSDLNCDISFENCSYFVFLEAPVAENLSKYKLIKDVLNEDSTDYGTGDLRFKHLGGSGYLLYKVMPARK